MVLILVIAHLNTEYLIQYNLRLFLVTLGCRSHAMSVPGAKRSRRRTSTSDAGTGSANLSAIFGLRPSAAASSASSGLTVPATQASAPLAASPSAETFPLPAAKPASRRVKSQRTETLLQAHIRISRLVTIISLLHPTHLHCLFCAISFESMFV